MSTIIPEEAPDTPRRHLLTLAHRALGFPNMSVEDEVALVSTIGDRKERGIVFDGLCSALARGDQEKADGQLAKLTAVAS